MSMRIKTIEQCHLSFGPSGHHSVCGEVNLPIREWEFLPALMDATHSIGEPAPANKYINIKFPELNLWNESNYDSYRFKISVSYENASTNWLGYTSTKLNGDVFFPDDIDFARIDLLFENLASLTPGVYNASIILEAYGIVGDNLVFVENRTIPVELTIVTGNNIQLTTDKEEYDLQFNKSTGVLSGDLHIKAFAESTLFISHYEPPFNLEIEEHLENDNKTFNLGLQSTELEVGTYSQNFIITYHSNPYIPNTEVTKSVIINLNVIEDESEFILENDTFNFLVQKTPSEVKTEVVNILNPNNIDIEVSLFPSFIENVSIQDNTLIFSTKASSELEVGVYSGEIIVSSQNASKTIEVQLKVVNTIESDFSNNTGYFFALDPNKIKKQKTISDAVYVKMHLEMYYRGFGSDYTEEQTYEFPYFKNQVEIYPGEEVQDFFIRCKSLDPLISPFFNYALTSVNIKITEHDDNDTQLSEYYLTNLLFAPGRKPKCFPLFTDYRKRSTRASSIIRVGFDTIMNKSEIADIFEVYQDDLILFPAKSEVHSLNLNRNKFKSELENEMISTSCLDLIPFPNIKNPVHIFWENQNLVFDWFTGAVKHSQSISYEHLFNSDDENSDKYGTKTKKTLLVNTGWILREEIDLINDLIKSRVCFLRIENTWIKGYPISKKNELWDSEENLFQMDIEFKINTDER